MSDFDPIAVLHKHSAVPPESVRFRPAADDDALREFGTGIVFVMAFWSGPCLKAFRSLTETLNAVEFAPPLLVVDIDDLNSPMIESIMCGLTNGWGETFWLFGGQITHHLLDHFAHESKDRVREFSESIVARGRPT